jgi:hypothetical protein
MDGAVEDTRALGDATQEGSTDRGIEVFDPYPFMPGDNR